MQNILSTLTTVETEFRQGDLLEYRQDAKRMTMKLNLLKPYSDTEPVTITYKAFEPPMMYLGYKTEVLCIDLRTPRIVNHYFLNDGKIWFTPKYISPTNITITYENKVWHPTDISPWFKKAEV